MSNLDFLLHVSEKKNLDGILSAFLELGDPEEMALDLRQAYFIIAEWSASSSENTGNHVLNALQTIRYIIEGLDDVNKPELSKIRISAR